MEKHFLDAQGMNCPGPTLKITSMTFKINPGDTLEVLADCATFEQDMREWCNRHKKILLWIRSEGNAQKCLIQF